MKFLADESCDFAVVRALRKDGHDVVAICETSPGAEDIEVLKHASREHRILITEDKDFGQLVFADGQSSGGVIFLRYPFPARSELCNEISKLIKQQGKKLEGCFTTLQPERIRVLRIPSKPPPK